jgi:CRP-like cAMP-binding protein
MFLVVEGLLDVLTESEIDGHAIHVSEIGPGEYFGEMCLLTGATRSATVIAMTDTVLFEIDKKAMKQVLARRPEISQSLAETAAERKRRLIESGQLPIEKESDTPESMKKYILKRMGFIFNCLRGRH